MSAIWPSVLLFAVSVAALVPFRFLGGRLTLGFGCLMLCFSYGAAGASLINLVLQRALLFLMPADTAAWTVGPPLEELTKAAPVLLLAYAFAGARRLSVADFALAGLASGLGFAFVETNLTLVTAAHVDPATFMPFFDLAPLKYETQAYYSAGHGYWTGFIGLGVGLGMRMWPRNPAKLLPALAFAALAVFEHAMGNWKSVHAEYLFGEVTSIPAASPLAEALYWVDLHGLATMLLLPLGLMAAVIYEGAASRASRPAGLMLPDEGRRPLVPREWIALALAAPRGRIETFRTAAFFRRRRESAFAGEDAARRPDAGPAARQAGYLAELVQHERRELEIPMPARWLPAPGEVVAAIGMVLRRSWMQIAVTVLAVVLFAIAPHLLPEWLRTLLFGRTGGLVLLAIAGALLVWRILAFRARPAPKADRASGEALVSHRLSAMLLATSAFGVAASAAALLLPAQWLTAAPAAGFIFSHWTAWLNDGGGPAVLALAPLVGTIAADPATKDPCADLRREAQLADQRIQELERLAANGAPAGTGQGPAAGSSPLPETDSIGRSLGDAFAATPLGKRVIQVCKPILGPHGEILGYAMSNETVDDAAPAAGAAGSSGADGSSTVRLPGGRRLRMGPADPSAAQAALDAERAQQKLRLAALADCDRLNAPPPPQTRGKPDVAALQKALDDAKQRFEDLEKQLNAAVADDLNAIGDFMRAYDQQWKAAIKPINDYLDNYKLIRPAFQDILNQFASREQALSYARFADEAFRDIAMLVAPELLPGGALAAESEAAVGAAARTGQTAARTAGAVEGEGAVAGAAARGAQTEATVVREAEALGGRGAATAAEEGAQTAAAQTHFVDATGAPTGQALLQPGEAGQQTLNRLMDGYSSTQNKVFADTVNKYAQQMIKGEFDWNAVPAAERIVQDGSVIVSGNHRFIAAKLASEATGRPLLGTADAIIPQQGFASQDVAAKLIGSRSYTVRPFGGVGVSDGAKAPPITQSVDPDLQFIRDATGGESD